MYAYLEIPYSLLDGIVKKNRKNDRLILIK